MLVYRPSVPPCERLRERWLEKRRGDRGRRGDPAEEGEEEEELKMLFVVKRPPELLLTAGEWTAEVLRPLRPSPAVQTLVIWN